MAVTDESSGPVERFRHEAFLYDDPVGFVDRTARFVREGLAADEAVLVALPPGNLVLLQDALGADAADVSMVDMTLLGGNPARVLPVWVSFAEENHHAGRPFRGVDEPLWPGRRPAEADECHLLERLLNAAFDRGPGWRLMCPYDAARLPVADVVGAKRSHPTWSGREPARGSEAEPADVTAAFEAPLPSPPSSAGAVEYGVVDLLDLRDRVAGLAFDQGLSAHRIEELVLAAGELATNSVRYGGGGGVLRHWTEPGALVLEFQDAGRIDDALVGRRVPALGREGGRGLFIVNQLCDLVQMRSSAAGTTVRVTTWL